MKISFSVLFGKTLMQFFKNVGDYEEYFDVRPNLESLQNTVAHCLQTGILWSDKQQCWI
jgi:hypothetical protein